MAGKARETRSAFSARARAGKESMAYQEGRADDKGENRDGASQPSYRPAGGLSNAPIQHKPVRQLRRSVRGGFTLLPSAVQSGPAPSRGATRVFWYATKPCRTWGAAFSSA